MYIYIVRLVTNIRQRRDSFRCRYRHQPVPAISCAPSQHRPRQSERYPGRFPKLRSGRRNGGSDIASMSMQKKSWAHLEANYQFLYRMHQAWLGSAHDKSCPHPAEPACCLASSPEDPAIRRTSLGEGPFDQAATRDEDLSGTQSAFPPSRLLLPTAFKPTIVQPVRVR
jgi:hypothetical protein